MLKFNQKESTAQAVGRRRKPRMTSRVLPCSARLLTLGLLSLGAVCLGLASVAHARVTQINISSVQSPTFGGASFGSVGTYEVITGTFTDEVDPSDPRNSVITDIALGPKNADGTVSFSADFQIIRPTDLSKGAHRVMYDWPNRGGPGALSTLNAGITAAGTPITAGGNTAVPPSAGTAGTGFLMNMGWSVVEVGWDLTAPQGGKLFGVTLPVAKNKDGSAITGPTTEELVVDLGTTPADLPLTYSPASLDQSKAMLTVRENYGDTPQVVPAAEWTYSTACTAQTDYFSPTCVKLTAGNFGAPGTFGPTALYEFTYIAQNPNIAGLGLAALRDFATFLRDAKTDDVGVANPLAGDVKDIYTICSSQPCRTTRDFVLFGFNDADVPAGASQHKWGDRSLWTQFWQRPPHHEKAIDGMLNYIGGGDGIYLNYRFAQPTRTSRQHIARWDPEFQFPFADVAFKDRVTHETGGRLQRCEATDTCPKIFETNSENEFWSKGGSMLTTDGQGHDLDLAKTPDVRYYVLASFQHGTGSGTSEGICRQLQNPLNSAWVEKALLVDLDDWASNGTAPPANQVPTIRSRTLVPALPQSGMGFPNIPNYSWGTNSIITGVFTYAATGPAANPSPANPALPPTAYVFYDGSHHTGDLWDFGPQFYKGIVSISPPVLLGTPYQIFVSKTDGDGNDIAGVRVPSVSVPIATYTGWAQRAGSNSDPDPGGAASMIDGCDGSGQYIPFPDTKAHRLLTGDPRPSLQERYGNASGTNANYVNAVTAAANALVSQRFLLPQDVATYVTPATLMVIPASP
jgi:Alpha/beta hydrolase domain